MFVSELLQSEPRFSQFRPNFLVAVFRARQDGRCAGGVI